MIGKKLEKVSEKDLLDLLKYEVAEGARLDYKRDLPADNQKSRTELISDISSFANSEGGDIIFGVTEKNGVPAEIVGVEVDDIDALGLQFENICRDNIEPRISGMQIHGVKIANGRKVIIIRVPQSWQSPHRNRQDRHFYARNSRGKFSMDTAQLRFAFNMHDSLYRRISEFRAQRLELIRRKSTPGTLSEGVKVIIHLVPLAALATARRLDLNGNLSLADSFFPMNSTGQLRQQLNIDGVISTSAIDSGKGYTQLFRNGIVEGISVFPTVGDGVKVVWTSFESLVANSVKRYIRELRSLQFAGPICIMLSLCNADQSYLDSGATDREAAAKLSIDNIQVPDIMLETDERLDDILKELYEVVWNAYGRKRAPDLSFQ